MGWGISVIAGMVAIALMWALNFVGWVKRLKWVAVVENKLRPILELVAVAGFGVVVIDWVLGWFGWSMSRVFNNIVGWVSSWGSGDLPESDLRKGIGIFLGIALVACILNVLGDCIVPKFQVNARTHASAFAAGVIPSLFVVGGSVGAFMQGAGGGLGGALTTFGSSIVGG